MICCYQQTCTPYSLPLLSLVAAVPLHIFTSSNSTTTRHMRSKITVTVLLRRKGVQGGLWGLGRQARLSTLLLAIPMMYNHCILGLVVTYKFRWVCTLNIDRWEKCLSTSQHRLW